MVPYLLGYFLLSANVRKYICTIPRLFKDITHDIILRPTIKQKQKAYEYNRWTESFHFFFTILILMQF